MSATAAFHAEEGYIPNHCALCRELFEAPTFKPVAA